VVLLLTVPLHYRQKQIRRHRESLLLSPDKTQGRGIGRKYKLFPHLWEIKCTSVCRMEHLMQELLATDPAPDKKVHQMEWVRHMDALRATAEEIVRAELIYC
jgi:hypothetical protein